MNRFWSKVAKAGDNECWEWTAFRQHHNYGMFWHKGKQIKATHMAASLAFGTSLPLTNQVVAHTCDNPPCVNPAHLVVCTQADNLRDMRSKGRAASTSGEDAGRAKLSASDVNEIRTAYRFGVGSKRLARLFGVKAQTISAIFHGKSWISA